jgi:DNA ligase-1
MNRFVETCEAVAATTLRNAKVRLVAQYLRSLPPENAVRAATFLGGRPFPRYEERVLGVGGSLIWQVVSELAGVDRKRMEEVYLRHGDLGDAAEELLKVRHEGKSHSLLEIEEVFKELAEARGPLQKRPLLEGLLRTSLPPEAKYAIKIMTGELRIGLRESLVEEAIAQAFGVSLADIQRANMLTGDMGGVFRLAAEGRLGEARLRLLKPIGFMLATPAESPEEILESRFEGVLIEDKYDGVRAQAHKQGDRVRFFSRTMDELVEFHELLKILKAFPGDFVMDGEIVGWRDNRALPFVELQKRLGRKEPDLWLPTEVPVIYIVFDLIYWNGDLLLDAPLRQRRRRLEELISASSHQAVRLSPSKTSNSPEDIQQAFEEALARGNEGLMVKSLDSPYLPGRRGRHWLKLKQPMATLEVVVTAVEYGHGKRHGLLSDVTFAVRDGERLINVGKAYSGLTDDEIKNLTQYFKNHTIVDEGFRRVVEPTIVLEVAFNNVQRSNRHDSGYALRFPRIVRLRSDKSRNEIDTLERVRELYERQSQNTNRAWRDR